MRGVVRLAVAALLACGVAVPAARAEEKVAWFGSVRAARKAADETGRPLLIAIHRRPVATSPAFEARMGAWVDRYHDPAVVEQTRAFACVLRLLPASPARNPDSQEPAVTHLVLDAKNRIVLRTDGDIETAAFVAFLRRARSAYGAIPPDAPRIDAARAARRSQEGSSPMKPVGLPKGVPGLRTRLRWELRSPDLSGAESDRVKARVLMRWDGEGPWPLGRIAFGAGEDLDHPVDVRFEELEGLAALVTEGTHRLDLYLEPEQDSYPFSRGPLHVGRVWIEIGEGGGGGGGGDDRQEDPEQPQEEPPEEPQPVPEGERDEPQPPPTIEKTEVVDPFVREGETIKKEDAVVAVEDPDGGVKPPELKPIEEALRDFEKMKERAIGEERLAPRERTFLQRYFEALRRVVLGEGASKDAGK